MWRGCAILNGPKGFFPFWTRQSLPFSETVAKGNSGGRSIYTLHFYSTQGPCGFRKICSVANLWPSISSEAVFCIPGFLYILLLYLRFSQSVPLISFYNPKSTEYISYSVLLLLEKPGSVITGEEYCPFMFCSKASHCCSVVEMYGFSCL